MEYGSYSSEDIERVRQANDLVEVFSESNLVRQKGRDFWCCCPFHSEKTPSLKIDPAKQIWHCFGCHLGGDLFKYVMLRDNLGFSDALALLAARGGIELTTTKQRGPSKDYKLRLKELCLHAAEFYHAQLMRVQDAKLQAARDYLSKRQFGSKVARDWTLGYAPGRKTLIRYLSGLGYSYQEMMDANLVRRDKQGNYQDRFYDRIMFPIRDIAGDVVAFGGRIINQGEPKYLNSTETSIFHKSEILFGLDKAKASIASRGTALVVEGYTDVIALSEAGVTNVVATLGTALTLQHLRLLARHAHKKILYVFDGDKAGRRAALRACEFIDARLTPEAGRSRVELCAVMLPQSLDPADFIAKEGVEAFKSLLNSAESLIDFGITETLLRFDLSKAEERSLAATECLKLIAPIKESLLAKDYARTIAHKLSMREEELLLELGRTRPANLHTSFESKNTQESAQSSVSTQKLAAKEVPQGSQSPQLQNRLRIEREFLVIMVHNEELREAYLSQLASIQWQSVTHERIAALLLRIVSEDMRIKPLDLMVRISIEFEEAASLLSRGINYERDKDLKTLMAFLAEELALYDQEQLLEHLKQEARSLSEAGKDGSLALASIVAMQQSLNARRRKQHNFMLEED